MFTSLFFSMTVLLRSVSLSFLMTVFRLHRAGQWCCKDDSANDRENELTHSLFSLSLWFSITRRARVWFPHSTSPLFFRAPWNRNRVPAVCAAIATSKEDVMGRGILLWLLGVPIPVIIILFLIFHH
jgi:hypothetical protein